MQRCRAAVILGVHIGPAREQQFRHFCVAFVRRHVQWRTAVWNLEIDVGLVGKQQFRHIGIAFVRRVEQSRSAEPVFCVDISFVRQQKFCHILVIHKRRPDQWCHSVVVFTGDQIGIAFKQRLDLYQVAVHGRVVNLAAEREAAPRESD